MVNYSTIDHALGNPRGRYFGAGHRRSVYTFRPDQVTEGRIVGTCSVAQEGTWSSKEAGVVSRHLSTIDAVSLAGLALESVLRLQPVAVESLFVTHVSIRAGSAATEDLTAVPLDASVAWDVTARAFDCVATVGTMRLNLTLVPIPISSAPAPVPVPAESPAFFGAHLQHRVQHLSDLDIDCESGRMRARLGALSGRAHSYSGLQSAHAGLLSISEAIVCLAQLAQAMAYEFDRISRDESAVFWLRRLTVTLAEPLLQLGRLTDVEVRVDKTSELRISGQAWRTLRLTAEARGVNAVADVAHVLPQGAAA